MTDKNVPLIIQYANKVAAIASFPGLVAPIPIGDWKRPVEQVDICGFTFLKLGIVTSAESAVINTMRAKINLALLAHKKAILEVLVVISDRLGVDNLGDLQALLKDGERLDALRLEKEIDLEEANSWRTALGEASDSIDPEFVIKEVREHILTFFCNMRLDPTWDYQHTLQLSQTEKEAILSFLAEEEAIYVPEQVEDPELTAKKP